MAYINGITKITPCSLHVTSLLVPSFSEGGCGGGSFQVITLGFILFFSFLVMMYRQRPRD